MQFRILSNAMQMVGKNNLTLGQLAIHITQSGTKFITISNHLHLFLFSILMSV